MRRLLAALIGGALGTALGAALAFSFRGAMRPPVAVVFAATVGVAVLALVRKPPHRHASGLETVWRSLLGGSLGAGIGLAAEHWLGQAALPFALLPLSAEARFVEHPIALGAATGSLLGLLLGIAPPDASSPTGPGSASTERAKTDPGQGSTARARSDA